MKTILSSCTIIDGTGNAPIENGQIVVENGLIESVLTRDEPVDVLYSGDDTVIDLRDMYALPGFVNVHEHVLTKRQRGTAKERAQLSLDGHLFNGLRNAMITLREGVTTIRDAGSLDGIGLAVKATLDNRLFCGPRMLAVSQGLTVTGGYAHHFFKEVDTEIEARKAAAEMIKRGADWIKCMASIEWGKAEGEPLSAINMDMRLMREAFSIAHHHGKRCLAHAVCEESIVAALDAGADTIEHGVMMSPDIARRMAEEGIYLVPTLSGWREQCNDWGRGASFMRHASLLRPYHERSFQNALEAGVRIAFGTDTLGSIVAEATAFHENGVSLMDCIVAATRNGAELLNLDRVIGTIESGKCADIVILGQNPLKSPAAFGDVRYVFREGRMLEPSMLPI